MGKKQFKIWATLSQPVFTCSNSTMETPEQCVKSTQMQQWWHQNKVSNGVLFDFEQI